MSMNWGQGGGGSVRALIAIFKPLYRAAGIYLLIFYLGFFINIHTCDWSVVLFYHLCQV